MSTRMKKTISKQNGGFLYINNSGKCKWLSALIKEDAEKVLYHMTDNEIDAATARIIEEAFKYDNSILSHEEFFSCVMTGLENYPEVQNSYIRSLPAEMVEDYREICRKIGKIMSVGDKESGTSDIALVSTQRTRITSELKKTVYSRYYLTATESEAHNEGYIYVHDMGARTDTVNCGLFDMEHVLRDGFEMGDIWYNEPETLSETFDLIASVINNAAAQLYGGFTVPQLDNILAYYAEKSYNRYIKKYSSLISDEKAATDAAISDLKSDFYEGFTSLENRLNNIINPRGEYSFTTITIGLCRNRFAEMAAEAAISVRRHGHGKPGYEHPALFPKLVFLFDKNLHSDGKPLNYLFEEAIECSSHVMYPEFLSLTGSGLISDMYKSYGEVISPMCCRAFLTPWYEKGGMKPADENDRPVFVGRFNIGVVSLNLPMILQKSRVENTDFYCQLDKYLEIIRGIHKKTYELLARKKAKINPLCFCQGGFYGGTLDRNDEIRPLLKTATASFGITALNELEQLYHGKSLVEDGSFALDVIKYINNKVIEFSREDGILYTVYGTPAETLCGRQAKQFKDKYGIIENVSDRAYVSNSFHCHVSENITPIEKQEYESRFWASFNGGKIQYVRITTPENTEALKSIVLNAMELGLYEGINIARSYCNDCGTEFHDLKECPKCRSTNITTIERMCGFLSYTNIRGESRLNDAKMEEIHDRVSM